MVRLLGFFFTIAVFTKVNGLYKGQKSEENKSPHRHAYRVWVGGTAADIRTRRDERGVREGRKRHRNRMKPGRRKLHTQQKRKWPKACKDR